MSHRLNVARQNNLGSSRPTMRHEEQSTNYLRNFRRMTLGTVSRQAVVAAKVSATL